MCVCVCVCAKQVWATYLEDLVSRLSFSPSGSHAGVAPPGDIWRSLETLWLTQLSGCCQQLVGRVGCCQTSHKGQDGSPGKMSGVLTLRNPVQICSNPTGIHRRKRRSKVDESVVTSSLKGENIKPSTPLTHPVSPRAFAASPLLALLGWVSSLAPPLPSPHRRTPV